MPQVVKLKHSFLPLTETSSVKQEFECQRASTVELSGPIAHVESARRDNAELVVEYMAFWTHGFFGIADGPVTEFRLATVSPDSNGFFQVSLPYLLASAADSSSQPKAAFRLMLRDSKTWNPIAFLEPEMPEFQFENLGLQILPHYPDGLEFKPEIWP
jgi:hypothetical protein